METPSTVSEQKMLMERSSFRGKPINAKHDNGLLLRRPSKEISVINSSTEVDYGISSVGVPFNWESEPGTPKIKYFDKPLPPLTPPPSYIYNKSSTKPLKKPSKSNILNSFILKFSMRKTSRTTPPSPVSSSSSRSSSRNSRSVPSSPFTRTYRRMYEEDECESPISTLCFGARNQKDSSSKMKVLLGELA